MFNHFGNLHDTQEEKGYSEGCYIDTWIDEEERRERGETGDAFDNMRWMDTTDRYCMANSEQATEMIDAMMCLKR
jgi:hypothetical protein